MKNVGNPGGPLPDYMLKEQADLDRWREIALLPCPFCGGQVDLEETTSTYSHIHGNRRWWGVICRNTTNLGGTCAIQQRPSASVETAATRWNTRIPAVAIAEAVAQERARIDRADKIILQLTMHHHSDPDYVKGYEQAQEYFADYAVRSMIPAPFPVIVDKEGNVLACVPINLKEPPK